MAAVQAIGKGGPARQSGKNKLCRWLTPLLGARWHRGPAERYERPHESGLVRDRRLGHPPVRGRCSARAVAREAVGAPIPPSPAAWGLGVCALLTVHSGPSLVRGGLVVASLHDAELSVRAVEPLHLRAVVLRGRAPVRRCGLGPRPEEFATRFLTVRTTVARMSRGDDGQKP